MAALAPRPLAADAMSLSNVSVDKDASLGVSIAVTGVPEPGTLILSVPKAKPRIVS
jgi:hypothetical protein